MAKQSEDQAGGGSHHVAFSVMAFLVLLYFGFPYAFLLPLKMVYGSLDAVPGHVRSVVELAFYPVGQLANWSPAYTRLLEYEANFLGL